MFLRYACVRLRLETICKWHSEIPDTVIDRPIIVAGLPRPGGLDPLQFGIAEAEIRNDFDFHFDRFPVERQLN